MVVTASRVAFLVRGFSDRTVDALIAHGVDAPERHLFTVKADLKDIPGIDKASFNENMRYRTRFDPGER